MTRFERQLEDRVRAFAATGAQTVDASAVAHAVAIDHPRVGDAGHGRGSIGVAFPHRALANMLVLGLLMALLGGALLVGARLLTTTPSPLGDEITIMSWLPRQGPATSETDSIVNAFNLAFKQRGYRAGDFTINYVDADESTAEAGGWTVAKESEIAAQAASDENIIGYLGTYSSGVAEVAIPILCKAGLAMISPTNTYPGLTKAGKGEADQPGVYYEGCTRNYHRVIPADDLQGLAGARWAATLGFKNVYVVSDDWPWAKAIADVFRAEAPGLGLEIVGGYAGSLGPETDFKALAEEIKRSGADLMYFGGFTKHHAGQLWRDVRAASAEIGLMGPDGILDQAFLDDAGDSAEGTYITVNSLPADKLARKGAEFAAAYQAEFPGAKFGTWTVYGYEAANVMLDAIERASASNPGSMSELRAAVLKEVSATSNYSGALGTWSFDQNGDTTLTGMSGHIVKDGEFAFETTIE